MRLIGFRVTNFRSVEDSGWIDASDVTALIGTNESGKTNLLMPLWKLNPAKGGEIEPLLDYPRNRYHLIRAMTKKPVFIEAHFELSESLATRIANLTNVTVDDVKIASVKRDLSGENSFYVTFPNAAPNREVSKLDVVQVVSEAIKDINGIETGKTEQEHKQSIWV